jgi:shikimate kinase
MTKHSTFLILVGLPASGKTTVAPLLAQRLGWEWKDTDACLEVWWKMNHGEFITTRDLYKKIGEEGFREIERRAIQQLHDSERMVVATGGGTLLNEETAMLLKSKGRFVYLRQSVETSKQRLANKAAFSLATLEQRLAVYSRFADYVIESESLTPEEIVDAILEAYGKQ